MPAIRAYLESFTPSAHFPKPHVILGVAVICAPTDREADYLAASTDLAWVRRHHGAFGPLPSPDEALAHSYLPQDRVVVDGNRQRHIIGSPPRVVALLRQLAAETMADELMVTTMIFGEQERQRSYELLADAWRN
jgi:alkanesulfonate monooxygenase SsuD/methylene tetrahydromethanopterin reductase-like flavin-dependent oxidoreductase (luciferase family)